MASQDKIVASVRELLGEIQKLKAEKNDTTNNPVKANYLQCEIFRKFAVIKSLMASNPDEMKAVKEEVLWKQQLVGAEDEDLKKMPVPKLLRAKAVLEWTKKEEEAFPYLHLPPEVKSEILGYLTSPSDKLNLVKAVPSDGYMMGWEMDSLQLELVLPIILKRESEQGIYEILVNLCHASEKLHGVVQNLMEKCAEYEDPNSLRDNNHFLHSTSHLIVDVAPKDRVLNPFPVTIHLAFTSTVNDELPTRSDQLQILRQIGGHIWSADIFLVRMPVLEAVQVLRDCLELMPNLRRLETSIRLAPSPPTLDRNQIVETFRSVQLPELPHLKYLSVKGFNMKPVAAKLLRKYQSTLEFLKTDKFSMTSPRGRQLYPRLRVLEVKDVEKTDVKMIVSRLKPFVGSALKSISINIGYYYNYNNCFHSLMCALSPFRDTVEHLFVKFRCTKSRGSSLKLDWMAKMDFPKVKTLCVRNYPESWDMLLHFPALEELTLHLERPVFGTIDNLYDSVNSSEIVELSCDKEQMYASNIWKLLPFLDKIWIRKGWSSYEVLEVTRSDCLAYQRRFEGVVLIDGRVRGNMEENGDGKVFVRQA